jgi:hypothetical protein
MNICTKNENLVKIGQKIVHFTRKTKYVLLSSATLRGITLSGQPRRHEH